MIGIPYARPNDDGTVTCPVCGERIAERHDADGERLTNEYGEHYERMHRGTPAELAEAEHDADAFVRGFPGESAEDRSLRMGDSEGDALAADAAAQPARTHRAFGIAAPAPIIAERTHALTVALTVRVPADADAANIAQVIMAALHVGLEGAADCGIDAPDPSDVDLSFVDDAQVDA